MKPLLLILLIAIPCMAQSYKDGENIINWTLMGENEPGTAKLYFAPESIRRNGDIIKVWIKLDFPFGSDKVPSEPLRAGRDFGSVRAYGVFNCSNLNATTADSTLVLYYDRNGNLAKRQKEDDKVRGSEEPNGLTFIFRYFCERVEVPPSGPPRLKP